MITTKSINILNLCVPCYNYCKYCLLSWDGNCIGIDYQRSVDYARKFYEWLKINHAEMNFMYYFGYSMEHPNLIESIKFMQETNSPGGEFLQFDGMKMRTNEELTDLFHNLKDVGIQFVDFTFYGTQAYHDKFAARNGDYDLMMRSLEIALDKGLNVKVGIPVTKENLNQLDELVQIFSTKNIPLSIFTPHSGGRGIHLLNSKITIEDYDQLSENVKKFMNRKNNKTPLEWLNTPIQESENRILTVSLTPSNINKLENQTFDETIKELEELDNKYYEVIPSFSELLKLYANENDHHLYSKKDIYFLYRNKYIKDNKIQIQEVNDERYSGSIRY